MPKEIKVPYGLREDQPIHVSEVESGLQQDIKCINCGGNLIARKGSKTVHHFAHHKETNCSGESALHKWAKRIIRDRIEYGIASSEQLQFEWECEFCQRVEIGKKHKRNLIKKAIRVEEEYPLEFGERRPQPDLVLFDSSNKAFAAIEVVVTHKPEDWVIDAYRKLGIVRIEFSVKSEKDLDKLKNDEVLKADRVDWCEFPKCQACGDFFSPRIINLVDAECWKCSSDIVIAYGDSMWGTMLTPKNFLPHELDQSVKRGAYFTSQYSKMAGFKYVANTCSFCGKITGDNFIHDYWYDPGSKFIFALECNCGNFRQYELGNETEISRAGKTVLAKGNNRQKLRTYSLEDQIDFGKQFVGRTLKEMLERNIDYAKWCIENTFFFAMNPDEIEKWNTGNDNELKIGGKFRKMNFEKIEKINSNSMH
jgi:hypothetical protein